MHSSRLCTDGNLTEGSSLTMKNKLSNNFQAEYEDYVKNGRFAQPSEAFVCSALGVAPTKSVFSGLCECECECDCQCVINPVSAESE